MSITAEQRKTDLVDRIAAEARSRVPAGQADSAELFVRRYFALVAPDDVIYTSVETLLGSALSLWQFGEALLSLEDVKLYKCCARVDESISCKM